MMVATFGEQYLDYRRRVPAPVPFRYGLPRRAARRVDSPAGR
jgi:hypothetical protein